MFLHINGQFTIISVVVMFRCQPAITVKFYCLCQGTCIKQTYPWYAF